MILRPIVLPLSCPPAGDLVGHGIEHGNGLAVVVQKVLHTFEIAIPMVLLDRPALAQRVRREVAADAEEAGGAFEVLVNRLPGPVALARVAVRKNVDVPRRAQRAALELDGQIDAADLACLLLADGKASVYGLIAREREHVGDAKPGRERNLAGEAIWRRKRREYMQKLGLEKPVGAHGDTPIIQS